MQNDFMDKTIFMVDDEKDLLDSMAAVILLHLKINIVLFNSPLEALKKIKSGDVPNLIISDIKMPKMDGLKFVSEIRQLNIRKPIIVMSAFANKSEAIQSLQLGVYGLLDKPLSYELLIHEITRALNLEEYALLTERLRSEKDLLIELFQKFISKNHERISNVENLLLNETKIFSKNKHKNKDKISNFLNDIIECNAIDREVSKVFQKVNELIAKQEAHMNYSI
ncbi:response regulator [Fluviispira multicolorata]|uniref:Response regulator n=1 Tax=Fluviispira multicolorata TaxID=2654512 RepID=A0A833JEN2_9BACT|nr:response regulator [Fluviispira multicolorata]KAB8033299.1 response regulator [Fluviispira multicolorata]